MHKGIIVFLDVPIEILARRINVVGTKSRPLLHQGSGGGYAKVMFFSLMGMSETCVN